MGKFVFSPNGSAEIKDHYDAVSLEPVEPV